ncbi:MAG: choice-of-anchor J domain-containing protein, partial [Flavobacteriales bacterium]|nr:choice-of-anchor J domain-containing protein [Flavobacteriales bacterium]
IILINYCVSAQYLDKDFNDLSLNSGGWTTQIIIDTTNWFVDSFGGDDFVKVTNYSNSQNVPSNTWLISPAVDLSSASQPMLSFETIMKWPGAALVLHISTDYDGNSNPTQQGTWTDITALATWDVDNTTWGSWTPSGDVDLSNYISSTTYIAYEYLGSANSGSTWEIDNIKITEGSAPPPPPPGIDTLSIYEIQFNNNSNGASNYEGSQVYTGGIVTAVRDDSSFYLTSGSGAWSGIYVYSNDYLLSEGDSVVLESEVDEYYELTELKNVTNLTVISSGNIFSPSYCNTAAADSEEFEGCFVEVSNAICNNDNAGFGEWIVNDGSGDLIIDDLFFAFTPMLNQSYTVRGVVTFSYGAFKLLPRNGSDVAGFISINETTENFFYMYPNPLNQSNLNITLQNNSDIRLFNLSGQLIKTYHLKSGNNILNLDFLKKGLYMIKCNSKTYTIAKT